MKKLLILFLFPLLAVSCKEKKQDEPKPDIIPGVGQNLFGKWLLSSSDATNWTIYEFTETARLNVEMETDGRFISGSGFYFTYENEPTISGSFTSTSNKTYYIDWIAKKSQAFQIDFEQYDSQVYLGEASIYRIVGNIDMDAQTSYTPKYRDYTGQSGHTGFSSINPQIATVDENSGEITAVSEGSTFVTFDTKSGKAVVNVRVVKVKTLAEVIVGTWIYNNMREHEWQKTSFFNDGTMAVEWGLDNMEVIQGSGTGNYTVTGNSVNFTVNSAGTKISQEWRVEAFNAYDCTYSCYSGSFFAGRYTGHKLLISYVLSASESITPEYDTIVGNLSIKGYKSQNEAVAKVSDTGVITAVAKGMTYIDVITSNGTGVIEVTVEAAK